MSDYRIRYASEDQFDNMINELSGSGDLFSLLGAPFMVGGNLLKNTGRTLKGAYNAYSNAKKDKEDKRKAAEREAFEKAWMTKNGPNASGNTNNSTSGNTKGPTNTMEKPNSQPTDPNEVSGPTKSMPKAEKDVNAALEKARQEEELEQIKMRQSIRKEVAKEYARARKQASRDIRNKAKLVVVKQEVKNKKKGKLKKTEAPIEDEQKVETLEQPTNNKPTPEPTLNQNDLNNAQHEDQQAQQTQNAEVQQDVNQLGRSKAVEIHGELNVQNSEKNASPETAQQNKDQMKHNNQSFKTSTTTSSSGNDNNGFTVSTTAGHDNVNYKMKTESKTIGNILHEKLMEYDRKQQINELDLGRIAYYASLPNTRKALDQATSNFIKAIGGEDRGKEKGIQDNKNALQIVVPMTASQFEQTLKAAQQQQQNNNNNNQQQQGVPQRYILALVKNGDTTLNYKDIIIVCDPTVKRPNVNITPTDLPQVQAITRIENGQYKGRMLKKSYYKSKYIAIMY